MSFIASLRFSSRLAIVASCVATFGSAQRDQGRVALRQAIRDVANDRVVAIVAAHPDDQWMLPAAYLRFHMGFRVAVIIFTRGEGGQNNTGPEVGDALGRIRTLETEASAEVLDCETWYLNRTDGGFCRSGREALELWGRRGTIEDLARVLRGIRPDIVLTTHDPTEQHGHDQGLLEALSPAVDLARSPEFSAGSAPPVDIHRLLRGAAPGPYDLSLLMDTVDADRGATYRQIAYRAFEKHQSQAPIRLIDDLFSRELRLVSLPVGDHAPSASLTSGIPSLFDRLRGRMTNGEIGRLREDLEVRLFDQIENRQGLLTLVAELLGRLRSIGAERDSDLERRIARRIDALERVARHAIAFDARVEVPRGSVAVPGEALPFRVRAHYLADHVTDLFLEQMGPGELVLDDVRTSRSTTDFDATLTLPNHFDPSIESQFLADTYEPALRVSLGFTVGGPERRTRLRVPLRIPVELRPAVELEIFPPSVLVPDGVDAVTFAVRVRRNTHQRLDELLAVRSGLGVQPTPISHRVEMADETLREYSFRLKLAPGSSSTRVRVRLGEWSAELPLYRVRVGVDSGVRVGLVRGVDDTARSILRGLGIDLVELTDTVLPTRDLSDLDTIVIDIRALYHRASARAGFNRLVEFARAGGRLVVFYHKDQEFNLEHSGFRGFPVELPLRIGKGRVTREDQPVQVLLPDHALMQTPNRIRPGDWDGWVQERGLYFPQVYSANYDELLSMADPDQPEERGSLLYGHVGDGEFVYCALALYRQLKNLHPGACRLFANLVSRPPRPR